MDGRRRYGAALAGALVALVFAVAFAATRVGGLQGTPPSGIARGEAAPEFTGIATWLNSDPLTLAGLRGSVVLIDFWTYSCVNCVRTFPHLRALDARYGPFGLRIVGVHSPEFAFEREVANVRAAVERHELRYPVAMDNDMDTWRAYRNNYWPRVYLIDASGSIRYDHIGEGGEDQIQERIRELLAEAGRDLPPPIDFDERAPSRGITPEVYAGTARALVQRSLANPEGYRGGVVVDYEPVDPADVRAAGTGGRFFLEGPWRAHAEYVEAAGDGARILLPFFARDVFFVGAGPARARAGLDGGPVPDAAAGESVRDGVITLDRSDLFTVLRLDRAAEHVLSLDVTEGFRLYTFTFG